MLPRIGFFAVGREGAGSFAERGAGLFGFLREDSFVWAARRAFGLPGVFLGERGCFALLEEAVFLGESFGIPLT